MSTHADLDQTPGNEFRSTGAHGPNRTSPGIRAAGEREGPMTCSVAPRGRASRAVLRRQIPRENRGTRGLRMLHCRSTRDGCANLAFILHSSTHARTDRNIRSVPGTTGTARFSQPDGSIGDRLRAGVNQSLFCYRQADSARRIRVPRALTQRAGRVASTRVNLTAIASAWINSFENGI